MRIRAIASVGVVLCTAITSYSIYLGIAEHVYTPTRVTTAFYGTPQGQVACVTTVTQRSTTTVPHGTDKRISCSEPRGARP